MVNPRYRPFDHIVDKLKNENQNKENSARLAHSLGTFRTTGWGEYNPEESVDFDSPYLYRPSITSGWSFEGEDDEADLRPTRYPMVSGGVRRWNINNNGFYTGAWVCIVVLDRNPFMDKTDPDEDPAYEIIHDFVFLGVAMKDLPSMLRGDMKEV